jgi:hypothetical protein
VFFEGLDSREEKAQSIVMLNHAAKLVKQAFAHPVVFNRTADFFKFVEIEQETAFAQLRQGKIEPIFEGGVGMFSYDTIKLITLSVLAIP